MKEIVKDKWLKALRSGEYEQGRDSLLTVDEEGNESFCCLGLLCEIHAQDTGGYWKEGGDDKTWKYSNNTGVLPEAVMRWSGISSSLGRIEGYKNLVQMNDISEYDFNQIADVIAKHWEKL